MEQEIYREFCVTQSKSSHAQLLTNSDCRLIMKKEVSVQHISSLTRGDKVTKRLFTNDLHTFCLNFLLLVCFHLLQNTFDAR